MHPPPHHEVRRGARILPNSEPRPKDRCFPRLIPRVLPCPLRPSLDPCRATHIISPFAHPRNCSIPVRGVARVAAVRRGVARALPGATAACSEQEQERARESSHTAHCAENECGMQAKAWSSISAQPASESLVSASSS